MAFNPGVAFQIGTDSILKKAERRTRMIVQLGEHLSHMHQTWVPSTAPNIVPQAPSGIIPGNRARSNT